MTEAFAFMRRRDIAGTRTEPSSVGTVVCDEQLPTRWDSNYLYVEREATAEEVTGELNRHRRKRAIVPDERLGAMLAPGLSERGYTVQRHVVMAQRRAPDRSPDLAREDGQVVSAADLYQDGSVAQIEDVATTAEYRNRGHASAVVLRAAAEARAAGAEFLFLVADDEDWPKDWYAKLGFDVVGRYYKFIRP